MFENLSDRLERSFKILKGEGKITEINVAETLKDVRKALLDADVNYKVAKQFTDTVKQKAMGMNVLTAIKPSQLMVKIVHDELAELMGVSQARLMRLFRNSTIFRSADEYLENLRLVRALRLLRDHPEYGIAAISAEAGYNSVRTLQRRMLEVVGMTPVEFRILVEK